MGILERLKPQPKWKHPDASVRVAGVQELSDQEQDLLASIARDDSDPGVRRAAVAKVYDPLTLAAIVRQDHDEAVREEARTLLLNIAIGSYEGAQEGNSLAALEGLSEARHVAIVAKSSAFEQVSRAALSRLDDPKALGSVARSSPHAAMRMAALERIADPDELCAIAMRSEHKDVGVAALERVTDSPALEAIAGRAKDKAVARRARAILRDREAQLQAEAAARERQRERQRQICEAVEALEPLTRSQGASRLESELGVAQAQWRTLDGTLDPDLERRYLNACERVRDGVREAIAREAEERAERERVARDAEAAAEARREFEHLQILEAQRAREEAERDLCAKLQSIVERAEALAGAEVTAEAREQWAAVRSDWTALSPQAAGIAASAELVARFAAAQARFAAREAHAREERERQQRDQIARARHGCERWEAVARSEKLTLKEAERALNDARSTADRFGSFPKRDREELVRRLKAVQSLLMPRVKELREMHEWAQWANVGVQEELIARVEALKSLDDLDKAAAHLRDIQARWKLASDVPKERSQALWLRFKTAHDEIWARCEAYFAAQAAERMGNLRLKEAVCERAESLADSTDWLRTAEEIKRLQAEWKTIGPVPRGQEKAVWERFRKACDRFFTRRHEDLARRKEQWAKNLAHKEALCAQAEALADSTDWESAAAQLRKLQTEWKTIGPVKKTRSEAIWQRFRTACDRFFERYGQRDRIARQAHMAEREELCQQLEALLSTPPDDGPQLLLERVQDIRRRWLHATPLLPGEAKSWNDRFRAALSRIIEARAEVFRSTDLDPEANRRKMETLCERVEGLVHAIAPAEAAASPAARLAAMWREALASNTIGGKVDEEAKWRAAGDEIRQAKAAFDRIGFVPPELDRVLSDRFERACRRFFAYRDQRRRQVPAVIRGS